MNALNTAHAEQSPGKTRINIEDPMAASKFAWDLGNRLRQSGLSPERPIILLCIGTDRSTGDCLGPLVGTKMDQLNQDFFIVYGTLDKPVHASNLRETLQEINTYFKNPFIIAVDACLGRLENVGSIQLGNGSLQPGAGVNKELPPVGQVHITGVVNVGGFMEYLVLQNTRLNLVMRLADVIVSGLTKTITEFHKQSARGV
ncbi:MAG TPA: spore protease YyaC [Bacillota bacterium]|jgi:putative sporulation protein YyaC|nr:spore protease YyaC [Peptococcaceae bacterium MAG4]NLW38734.1 spore protease YyaC [Peptococcaceae bacterium]HPZ44167.1 spore protease YyaC [Bacillota bacterium]HQD76653.1 spore protease YyaC [Bacillota bacterium]HUM59429.1 spore protease YyaC [Bacillota bacterium]